MENKVSHQYFRFRLSFARVGVGGGGSGGGGCGDIFVGWIRIFPKSVRFENRAMQKQHQK
jgi:hypothetical protein